MKYMADTPLSNGVRFFCWLPISTSVFVFITRKQHCSKFLVALTHQLRFRSLWNTCRDIMAKQTHDDDGGVDDGGGDNDGDNDGGDNEGGEDNGDDDGVDDDDDDDGGVDDAGVVDNGGGFGA